MLRPMEMQMDKGDGSKPTATQARKISWESGEFQRVIAQPLLPPEVMKTLKAFEASPAMKHIKAFTDSPAGRALRELQESSAFESFKVVAQQIRPVAISPEIGDAFRSFREIGEAFARIQSSPLMDYFASDGAPKLGRLVEGSGHAVISIRATGEGRVITAKELELEKRIVERLERGEGVAALTRAEQAHLGLVLDFLKLLLIWLATQNGVREELCHFQPKILPHATHSQVGKSVRSFLCEAEMPVEMLRSYRTVKGIGVHLRAAPGMKAEVVPFTLEDRALLEVLNSSNRDWLHVSVVNEDGVEGWVSRKYTYPLLR